jgi:PrtD family type I secretion system ABC transporter
MKNPMRRQNQREDSVSQPTLIDETLRAIRPALGLIGGFSICTNILRLTVSLYMLQLVDRVLSSGNEDTLLYLTVIAVFALITGGAIMAVVKSVQTRIGSWIEATMIEPTLQAALGGKLTNRSMGGGVTRDLAQVKNFYSGQTLTTLFDLPFSPLFIVVIYLLHPTLGFVATGFAVILLAMAAVNDLLTRELQEKGQQENGRLNEQVGRASRNADLLHAMGMVPAFLAQAVTQSAVARSHQDKAGERGGWISAVNRTIRQIAQIGMFATGAYLALEGEATTGVMMAGSILLNLALSPVDQSMTSYRQILNYRQALTRLRRQLSVVDPRSQKGRTATKAPRGELVVERAVQLLQSPGRTRPLLKQINFAVHPGQMLGIIGPSGSGKSLLCRMLVGLSSPTAGSVQLDGVDMHEWMAAGGGRYSGYVSQDACFFPGTVGDNIARFDPPSLERQVALHAAAELVQAHGTIMNLPQGYETDMDEVVSFLSRGELQKIALARAIYGNPRLVVLDEPANALDRMGEAALVSALAGLKEQGCTIVVVSQRPNIMRLCDNLLLLRDGAMDAYGDPATVLEGLKNDEGGGPGRGRRLRVAHG